MGVGSSSDWSYFEENKWKALPAETSKQIDNVIRKNWSNSKSNIITFPLTKGHFFWQHAGVYFCRIGLNSNRTQIIESALGNKETGNEAPMRRVPPFKMYPYRNNYNYNNRNQGRRRISYNNEPTHKVMIRSPRGTVTRYMTEYELRNYGYLINKPRTQTYSNHPVASTPYDSAESKLNENIVNVWDYKQIDGWTCNELQEWIISLNLDNNAEKKIVCAISEQEITGTDFNTMEEYGEIADSFEISQVVSKRIWNALVTVRSKSIKAHQPQNSGIIGLRNLGNTCFINAVIQALLQTPGLIHALRIWPHSLDNQPKNNNYFANNSMSTSSMLDAFIEAARAAFQANAAQKSFSPKSIVKCLRTSDVKFCRGQQGDALSAVSKMLELLDSEMIGRARKAENRPLTNKHSGSWYDDGSTEMDEDELLECEWWKYNPETESIIRDSIHFVEQNIFTCLQCGWTEPRYDVKDKILLPLQDRSISVSVDIYIPCLKTAAPMFRAEFVVLDYCPLQTLRYQIYYEVASGGHMELNDINQISMFYINPQQTNAVGAWIRACDEKENCSALFGQSVFAVVGAGGDGFVAVNTFHVFIDKDGAVDEKESYLQVEEIKEGDNKSFAEVSKVGYPKKQIYFDEKVLLDGNAKYECRILSKDAFLSIVCFWMAEESKLQWNTYDMSQISVELVTDIADKLDGNVANFKDIVEFIKSKDEKERLTNAMITYQALSENQMQATHLVFNAFAKKYNVVLGERACIRKMERGYKTYCGTKVMDRGAVVICRGSCGGQTCQVFKQETKIVRFPAVLIFGIDRYFYGKKFEDCVGYEHVVFLDGNKYELYAVCNHSGGLEYGHYWAFVKGMNENQWYFANDSKIKRMDAAKAINQATAILLFYKKSVN